MRLFVLLIGLSILSWSCENDIAEVNKLFEVPETNVEMVKEVEMLYSDSAIVRVRVVSPTLVRYLEDEKPRDEFPDGIHVDFLDTLGQVESTLDAQTAIRYTRDRKVIVRSELQKGIPVVLQNNRGEKLETSELIWEESESRVLTDKFVKITKPEEIIFAYGFSAKQDFSEYTLQKVVARIKVQGEGFKN